MSLFQNRKAVLIDLDGTLVDSVPDLANAIDQMMLQLAMPARGIDAVTQWIGNGADRLVKRALVNSMEGEPSEALLQKALPLFEVAYAANNGKHSYLYDGVEVGLNYLHQQGYRLGCVTNKPIAFTLPLLEAMGIADFFDVTIGGDQVERIKPDPQPLLMAAEELRVDPKQAVMLGDSVSDVMAARAAGMPIICVSYGYNHGQDIRSHDPDAVIDSLAQLKTLI
ncbi:MAG: phosphoglycolate phosphatase [Flavobacteriales bacterium]|jgi:phosphoglycolate phosphatase